VIALTVCSTCDDAHDVEADDYGQMQCEYGGNLYNE
jgi:hypothetical protein